MHYVQTTFPDAPLDPAAWRPWLDRACPDAAPTNDELAAEAVRFYKARQYGARFAAPGCFPILIHVNHYDHATTTKHPTTGGPQFCLTAHCAIRPNGTAADTVTHPLAPPSAAAAR
jgi:hypothetical protein